MPEKGEETKEQLTEVNLCDCGSPQELKNSVGWGLSPIQVCTNPLCPYKKKEGNSSGWCR